MAQPAFRPVSLLYVAHSYCIVAAAAAWLLLRHG